MIPQQVGVILLGKIKERNKGGEKHGPYSEGKDATGRTTVQ